MSLIVERIPGPDCQWCKGKGCLVCTSGNVVKEIRLVFHMHDWCDVDEVLDQIKDADAFDRIKAMVFVDADMQQASQRRPKRPPQWGEPGHIGSDDDEESEDMPTAAAPLSSDPDRARHHATLERFKDDFSLFAHHQKTEALAALHKIETMTTQASAILAQPRKRPILAFLQNTWVKDPARVQAMFDRHPMLRHRLIEQLLFSGGKTGKVLGFHFAPWLDLITWEECSPEITGSASAKVTPDPAHMLAAFKRHQPSLVLTFGTLARDGWHAIPAADTNGQGALHGAHPTARTERVGWEAIKKALGERWPAAL